MNVLFHVFIYGDISPNGLPWITYEVTSSNLTLVVTLETDEETILSEESFYRTWKSSNTGVMSVNDAKIDGKDAWWLNKYYNAIDD